MVANMRPPSVSSNRAYSGSAGESSRTRTLTQLYATTAATLHTRTTKPRVLVDTRSRPLSGAMMRRSKNLRGVWCWVRCAQPRPHKRLSTAQPQAGTHRRAQRHTHTATATSTTHCNARNTPPHVRRDSMAQHHNPQRPERQLHEQHASDRGKHEFCGAATQEGKHERRCQRGNHGDQCERLV